MWVWRVPAFTSMCPVHSACRIGIEALGSTHRRTRSRGRRRLVSLRGRWPRHDAPPFFIDGRVRVGTSAWNDGHRCRGGSRCRHRPPTIRPPTRKGLRRAPSHSSSCACVEARSHDSAPPLSRLDRGLVAAMLIRRPRPLTASKEAIPGRSAGVVTIRLFGNFARRWRPMGVVLDVARMCDTLGACWS